MSARWHQSYVIKSLETYRAYRVSNLLLICSLGLLIFGPTSQSHTWRLEGVQTFASTTLFNRAVKGGKDESAKWSHNSGRASLASPLDLNDANAILGNAAAAADSCPRERRGGQQSRGLLLLLRNTCLATFIQAIRDDEQAVLEKNQSKLRALFPVPLRVSL